MTKKLVIMVLGLVLIFSFNSAFAVEVQPYASTLIMSNGISISNSGSTISANASITTKVIADTLGFSSIRIQVKQGTQWVTVKSVSSQYKTNGVTHTYTLTYTGTAGNEYRAVAGFYALDGDISDTRSATSSTLSI